VPSYCELVGDVLLHRVFGVAVLLVAAVDAPQKPLSVIGLMHASPHRASLARQTVWHVPAVQVCPPGHTVPAEPPKLLEPHPGVAPQYELFVCGSMHALLQSTSPLGHTHAPPAQVVPPMQTKPGVPPPWPHPSVAPQYVLLLTGLMHVPLHSTRPLWHDSVQAPLEQRYPAPQTVPGLPASAPHPWVAPQFVLLVCGLTHWPPQSTSGD
jgi:hypothetical protein